MISAQNLSKYYDKIKALDNISFEIKQGEVVGFLGPNGAGKTTLMKILTCYMPPTHGDVSIQNISIDKDSFSIRSNIGYLAEDNPLYLNMTVYNFLYYMASLRSISPSEITQKIINIIQLCDLETVQNMPIQHCSKGFRQRVGLAQALIHSPKVLILDEPTSGLDPNQIIEMRKLIKSLSKNTTVIICSHILSEITATCDRVFILNKGNIILDSTIDALPSKNMFNIHVEINANLNSLKDILANLSDITSIKLLESDDEYNLFSISVQNDIREQLFSILTKKKYILKQFNLVETSLEDIFISLTKDQK